MSQPRDDEHEVLAVAVELQDAADGRRDDALGRDAVREAAAEIGIAAEHVASAEVEVERRRVARVALAARRRRRLLLALAVVAALGALVVGWRLLAPAPAAPWSDRFVEPARWSLDVSPGTEAALRWDQVAGRGRVAAVTVSAVTPRPDGTWYVNLDRQGVPADTRGYQAVVVELEGSLPAARVYLEAGSDQRWRSPPIAVQPTWTRHRIDLDSFEHQRRVDGRWQAAGGDRATEVAVLSVKLGWFVNPPQATGVVRLARVELE